MEYRCERCGNKLGEIACSNRYGGSFCSVVCAQQQEIQMTEAKKEISKRIPFIKPNINFENIPTEPTEDIINKPNHYHKNEIDVNGYLEKHFPKQANVTVAEGFYIGNVIKYVSRHKEKGKLQDLEKAMFNLNRLVELNKQ